MFHPNIRLADFLLAEYPPDEYPAGWYLVNQALLRAIPFFGEYSGPRFDDKFRSANQMDGILKTGGDKMAAS